MSAKKKDKSAQKKQLSTWKTELLCHECGRTVKDDEYSWEEDDEGKIYYRDCRDDIESCGCSDCPTKVDE